MRGELARNGRARVRGQSSLGPAHPIPPALTDEPGGSGESRRIPYGQALLEAVAAELTRDPRVILLGSETVDSLSGLVDALGDRFGARRVKRVAGTGSDLLAEALAAGRRGLRPFVEIPSVAPCLSSWAGAPERGPAGRPPPVFLLHTLEGREPSCARPLLQTLPRLRVVAASDPFAAQGLVQAGLRGEEPILCLTHRALLETRGEVPKEDYVVSPAKARVLRQGKDVTLAAHHVSLLDGLATAGRLAEEGVSVEVLDPVSLSPLDHETLLASVRKTGRLVTVEGSEALAGLSAEMAAVVYEEAFFDLDAPVRRVGARERKLHGEEGERIATGPTEICQAIMSIL